MDTFTDMVSKPTDANQSVKVSYYIMNVLCPLHVSVTLVAIFREVHLEEWIYR